MPLPEKQVDLTLLITSDHRIRQQETPVFAECVLQLASHQDIFCQAIGPNSKPVDLSEMEAVLLWFGADYLPDADQYAILACGYDQFEPAQYTTYDFMDVTDATNGKFVLHFTPDVPYGLPNQDGIISMEVVLQFPEILHKKWTHIRTLKYEE